MTKTVVFAILLVLPHFSVGQNKSVRPDTLVNRLGNTFIADPKAAGLSIGVYHNGNSYYYNFGTTAKGRAQAPTENSLYETGSVTKTFVALVLAKAVVEKKVELNDDIRKYLDGDYPNLQYNQAPITLEQLANATAGLPDWLPATPDKLKNAPADSTAFFREQIYGAFTPKDFFAALHTVELDTVPGFKRRHSNAGAQLLGYILEKVYGTSMDKLIAKFILVPNKMNSTSFLASGAKSRSLTTGYGEKGTKAPYFNTAYLQYVGGLYSTTADLLKFIRLQLEHKDPAIILSQKESFNAGYYSACLNWLKYKHENGNHQLWTDGGTYGYTSYVVFYPEINSGIVLLANVSDDSMAGKLGDMAYQVFDYIQKNNGR
ncbi:MAG: hypothetical protein ABS85_00740 [Sphingobacteriales bacterium SCN 48-20]|uniref:serine hydrolase domain-containing protein n=1 Tax=Terrimonas ferruginea TaxID=249 RepID=UPI00086D85E4|nr:serine hydrolase domain-containing protein [Terrimonas ferruginea]MBN8782168.1 beta-lactamase family protein [Terrimonas ferruginea]ODT95689.1 MAG: hypothetical protein ABS85_00740 [Sphingobacteriales bacterium SCN 48-20]OJW42705.1 MAG: hypothetical protein BGO56_11675 [Sphingobacteriales bacterium 48-107]